jgi:hypothetical protein
LKTNRPFYNCVFRPIKVHAVKKGYHTGAITELYSQIKAAGTIQENSHSISMSAIAAFVFPMLLPIFFDISDTLSVIVQLLAFL